MQHKEGHKPGKIFNARLDIKEIIAGKTCGKKDLIMSIKRQNLMTGAASIAKTGVLKVDGKKYELAENYKERFVATKEKVDLNGRTLAWLLNKEGEVCAFKFQGGFTCVMDTDVNGKEGKTYPATYVVAIGYPTKPQAAEEEKPLRFNLLCNEKKGEKPTAYATKIWDEEIKSRFLAAIAGEKMPLIEVDMRESTYKGRKYYTLLDFNVIE
jgi:hypothetical protein